MQTKTYRTSHAGGVSTTMSLLLLGIVLTLAATVFTFRHLQPEIEQDLTAGVASALQGSGVNDISVDGQDVILKGTVSDDGERDRIEEVAASVYGVSRVINQLSVGNEIQATGNSCLLYTSPSPRDATLSRMPSSA